MPKFQYKAMNMSGNVMEGVYEAPNQQSVSDMIRQKSYYQLEVKEIVDHKDIQEIGIFARIKAKELSIYCRQFSSILKAGIPMVKCLSMLANQTENKTLKMITFNVLEEIQKGSTLSQAMSLHSKKLPMILIHMVEAGEASGTLEKSFDLMAVHFEKEHKTQQKVKSAMRYPMIVVIVAIAVLAFMLIKVVPTFADMFSNAGEKLPLPTRILTGMSGFLTRYGIAILVGIAAIVIAFRFYLSTEDGRLKFDRFKFKVPLMGKFLTKSIAARFARTMSTLMLTGVGITEALEITGKVVDNAFAKYNIMKVIEQVKEGKGLYNPVRTFMHFPAMMENMIMMGEESGDLDNMLQKSAEFYEDEVDTATQNLTSLMEPIIIVILAGMVGFIVIGIAMPMFGSYDFAGQS